MSESTTAKRSDFTLTGAINLSPETIASLLNETETSFLKSRGMWHANRRRPLPFWKVCRVCSKHFACTTRAQAERNETCSKACASQASADAQRGRSTPPEQRPGMQEITCSVCGQIVWKPRAWLRNVTSPTCSRECNGVQAYATGLLAASAHKGLAWWTPERRKAWGLRMRGPNSGTWKGGVTYKRSKGNYLGPRYVKCPAKWLPMARADGYVMEHRLIVAMVLGRCLSRAEAVHHMNHRPRDNRPENLALFRTNGDHKRFEGSGMPLPIWCGLSTQPIEEPSGA